MYIFCQETDDSGGGSYDGKVTFGLHPDSGKPYLFVNDDSRDRTFFDSFGSYNEIPMVTSEHGYFKKENFVNWKVEECRKNARQARFEYGECPKMPKKIYRKPHKSLYGKYEDDLYYTQQVIKNYFELKRMQKGLREKLGLEVYFQTLKKEIKRLGLGGIIDETI